MIIKRKRYFVKKLLQTKYILFVLLAMIIPTLVCGGALYYLIWQTVAEEIAIPEAISSSLIPALNRVNTILIIAIPLVFLIMFLLSIFISHKIAGPLYRLEKELKEIAKGDFSRKIKLRPNDELQEIAEGINELLDHLNQQKK